MVLGVHVPIRLRNRIETLKSCIALVRWQTLNRRAHETILKRLHEPQLVFLYWAAECESGSKCFDATPFVTAVSEPRKEALRLNIKFVCTGTRCYRSDSAGEFAVLRPVWIGEHLNRFNRFNRQVKSKLPCDGI